MDKELKKRVEERANLLFKAYYGETPISKSWCGLDWKNTAKQTLIWELEARIDAIEMTLGRHMGDVNPLIVKEQIQSELKMLRGL